MKSKWRRKRREGRKGENTEVKEKKLRREKKCTVNE